VSDLEARIDELKVRIDLARVKAPFSGQLGMRNFSPGAFLSQGDMITRLVQNQKLKIDFTIPARYASLAKEGLTVQVISSAAGDTINARIYAVDPVIDANTRSLRLRGVLENDRRRLVAGDFAQVIMQVEQNNEAILVPSESIISELNAQIVFVVNQGKAKKTQVKIGTSTSGRVQILQGLQPGDTILITGLMQVRDGSPVNITELNQEAGR
ncbi:MAG: efflux RND transporter periplasmic adaptor subunit, partial [Bacteroidota bacterium]